MLAALFDFSVSPVRYAIPAALYEREHRKNSPESGCEVSWLVEMMSRRIHNRTTKSYASRVESVYL